MTNPKQGSLRFCIIAKDRGFANSLRVALRLEALRLFLLRRGATFLRHVPRERADILVFVFDRAEMDDAVAVEHELVFPNEVEKVKVFVQLAAPQVQGAAHREIHRKNRAIEQMGRRAGAHLVTMTDLMRTGIAARLRKSGAPNLYGYLSLAHVILKAIRTHMIRADVLKAATEPDAPDSQALPLASGILDAVAWEGPALPATLDNAYSAEPIDAFLSNLIFFPSRGWRKFPMGDDIDWAMEGANWSWQSYFTGLEFLRPVLCYWFAWAHDDARAGQIDEVMRRHAAHPNDLLARAGAIIADFVRKNPLTRPANQRALLQGTLCRRVKVLLTYLVCCRKARDLGIAVDEGEFAQAFRSLVEAFEILKSDEIYTKAGNHGLRQDVLFVLAGLLLPKLSYAQDLMRLGLRRLEQFQCGPPAMSSDGVWLEHSYGYHCLVMNIFVALLTDLRTYDGPTAETVRVALLRMWPFAEGLIKCDGFGPLIGDTPPQRYFPTLARTHDALHRGDSDAQPLSIETFERAQDTYFFSDGGYFASHSNRRMDPTGSSLIFIVNLVSPHHKHSDDLSIIFSHGADDLLIDGGTYNKEISDTVRNSARFDPAAHNTFRVNGKGYPLRTIKGMKVAGLTGMWEGPGWAAARGYNQAYPDARVDRLVVHLKQHHAIIVFDRLSARTASPALFEQYWHISPDFKPHGVAAAGKSVAFISSGRGRLTAAFDAGESECDLGFGSEDDPIAWLMLSIHQAIPTPYIRRSRSLRSGAMSSLFQWSAGPVEAAISFLHTGGDTFEIEARGEGFRCKIPVTEDGIGAVTLSAATPTLA